MSIHSEIMQILDCGGDVTKMMAPDDASKRPVHFPHAVAYWSTSHYRVLMEALRRESHVKNQLQITQEFIAAAFMMGVEFGKQGLEYTPCTCGQLTADSVEELMANAWRHKFNDSPGEPPEE